MIVCYYHTGFRQIYFPLWKCFRNLTANTFEPQLPRLSPRRPTKVLPKLRLWQLFLQLFGQTKGNRKIGGVDPPTFGQRYGWARVKATFVPATSFLSDFPLPLSWLAKWLKFQQAAKRAQFDLHAYQRPERSKKVHNAILIIHWNHRN